jgi:putative transposase
VQTGVPLRGCFQIHKFVLFAAGVSREGFRVEKVMYPSNLTDAQWGVLELALNSARTSRRGRPVVQGMRRVLDAILYGVKTGCQWRQLPKEFGPWMTVYSHYRRMKQRQSWDRVLTVLRQQTRVALGHKAQPSVAIVDSQSVSTTSKGDSGVMMQVRELKGASDT